MVERPRNPAGEPYALYAAPCADPLPYTYRAPHDLGARMAQTAEGFVVECDGHDLHSSAPLAPETLARLGLVAG